jgi:outer membrane protein assembly factor BamB
MRLPTFRHLFSSGFAAAVLCSAAVTASADDWPQWMGPHRDGTYSETGLIDAFPEEGAKILWRTPIAGGYSGPAVVGDRVFITDFERPESRLVNDPGSRTKIDGTERVLCLDATSGKVLWKHEYPCHYAISYAYGPRCTPTVAEGKVYALGAEGNLLCLDAETGDVVWKRDLKTDYKCESPIWGFSGHPLVDGDKLFCLVGGRGSILVAFDKNTGRELWRAIEENAAGYCPPSIIEAAGVRQLILWTPQSIYSVNPETGKEYWSVPLQPQYEMSIMMPRKSGDFLFASGIGDAAAMLKLSKDKPGANVVWRGNSRTAVFCANSTPILADGMIYGCDCRAGSLRAVKLESGERVWETFAPTTGNRRGGHGTAFLVKNGERYFLFSETGHLIIAELSPTGYKEISRAKVVEPTQECFGRDVIWSHPAFARKCAFVRNDKEIVCVSLAKE